MIEKRELVDKIPSEVVTRHTKFTEKRKKKIRRKAHPRLGRTMAFLGV